MTTFSCLLCPRIPKHPSSRKPQTQGKHRASHQAISFVALDPWVLNILADIHGVSPAQKCFKKTEWWGKKAKWSELNWEKSRKTSSSQVKMRLFSGNHWYCKKHPPFLDTALLSPTKLLILNVNSHGNSKESVYSCSLVGESRHRFRSKRPVAEASIKYQGHREALQPLLVPKTDRQKAGDVRQRPVTTSFHWDSLPRYKKERFLSPG